MHGFSRTIRGLGSCLSAKLDWLRGKRPRGDPNKITVNCRALPVRVLLRQKGHRLLELAISPLLSTLSTSRLRPLEMFVCGNTANGQICLQQIV